MERFAMSRPTLFMIFHTFAQVKVLLSETPSFSRFFWSYFTPSFDVVSEVALSRAPRAETRDFS